MFVYVPADEKEAQPIRDPCPVEFIVQDEEISSGATTRPSDTGVSCPWGLRGFQPVENRFYPDNIFLSPTP